MSKFCTSCGKEIPEGVTFCTECGAKIESVEPTVAPKVVEVPRPQPTPQVAPKVAETPVREDLDETVGVGFYFSKMFLYAIPVVGWVLCILNAIVGKNKSKKNFARAMLLWLLIAAVLGVGVFFLVQWASTYILDAINSMSGLDIKNWTDITKLTESGILSQFEELQQFGDIADILEQLKQLDTSGIQLPSDLSNLPIQ